MCSRRVPHILLCVTGCIAAYKAAELVREFQRAGAEVRVAETESAQRFVGPLTFSALTHHEVLVDLFGARESFVPHIDLTTWADVVVVAPADANMLAKMACGIADDAVSTLLLAAGCPVVVAPAMNERMWGAPATRHNVQVLVERGVSVVAPTEGYLVCQSEGTGRLAELSDIVQATYAAFDQDGGAVLPKRLNKRHVVITAGPTREAIDPVRYLSNASSGKMGYALAEACVQLGASVTLISGPVSLDPPQGVTRIDVVSTQEMLEAARRAFASADAAICCAAVADYAPCAPASAKLKKRDGGLTTLSLKETPDIVRELASVKGDRVVIGFAAETESLIANAKEKLTSKNCDLIVGNDVSRPDSRFGSDTNAVVLVSQHGVVELPCLPKVEVAARIAQKLADMLERRPR